jgi:hypothetical protein
VEHIAAVVVEGEMRAVTVPAVAEYALFTLNVSRSNVSRKCNINTIK